jgi:predicted amidohydrolase YtcJ
MMKMTTLTSILIAIMFSCTTPKEKADLIVRNAKVYTVDDEFALKQAFAVRDGKFIAVGSDDDILEKYDSDDIVDAGGKPVYPGFYDAHCHFFGYGTNLIKRADLVGTTSFEEVVERLKEHHAKYPTDWIEGRGWDQNDWAVKEFPTKDLLDAAFPNNPVYLIRIDGHAALVNSEALKRAGITHKTKVTGGEVLLEGREPTGLLIDNAMDIVLAAIPDVDEDFIRRALLSAQENCFAVGLTSVGDAGLGRDTVLLIDKMQQEGDLKMRIYAMLSPSNENLAHFVANGPYETDQLTVRSVKLYADGALGSRGAKMIEPYSDDPDNTGLFMYPAAYYYDLCNRAYDNNYQVNAHAIGDGGNRFLLDTYAEFLEAGNDRRWRIEHAQIVHPDDFQKFGAYGIIPSVQPTHATSDMYWAEERVGPDRIKGGYAFKQLLDENGWIPLGTDFPVEDINPLYTFYAAVARKDLKGWPKGGYQPENALSREEALRGMTIWAAKAGFEEGKKGSIEPGKFADFVILDKDIMRIELHLVPEALVVATFSGGEKVYPSTPQKQHPNKTQ